MCPNIESHEPMTHQCPASLCPRRYWYFHRWSYMQHWKADLGMNFIIIHNHATLCKIWKPCHWLFQLTIKLKSGTHNDPSIMKQHSCQNLNQDMTHWFVIRYNISILRNWILNIFMIYLSSFIILEMDILLWIKKSLHQSNITIYLFLTS